MATTELEEMHAGLLVTEPVRGKTKALPCAHVTGDLE